jgi:hypothetical protein
MSRSTEARGLSAEERQSFYHLPEGSEHFWLPLLRALPNPGDPTDASGNFKPFLAHPERFGLLPDPKDPRGLPVGMAALPPGPTSSVTRVGFNCASCHVGELRYRGETLRVDGAPGMFQFGLFIQRLGETLKWTLADPERTATVLERLAVELHRDRQQATGAEPDVEAALREAYPDSLQRAEAPGGAREALLREVRPYLAALAKQPPPEPPPGHELFLRARGLGALRIRTVHDALNMMMGHLGLLSRYAALYTLPTTKAGPGRADAFDTARNLLFAEYGMAPLTSPVSYPHLWGLSQQQWFHYDGNTNSTLERNLGQALGVGALFDPTTHETTLLLGNLQTMERLAWRLEPPCWPEERFGRLNPERVERGARLFQRHCAECHSSPAGTLVPASRVGTDPTRLQTFNQPLLFPEPGDRDFAGLLGRTLRAIQQRAPDAGALRQEGDTIWRGTDQYLAKPLAGIWATAPYLHNGSVPTLWDLLQPAARRPRTFIVGHLEYDPVDVGLGEEPHSEEPFRFIVTHPGNSNIGHEYGTELSEAEKRDLIEYLKAL